MLFWNNDYSRGLAGHMQPVTSAVRPASAQCCCCVIFHPMDWWSRIVNTENWTGLPRRIDQNEYYFALLYIVPQVTIPYSALQFQRNSPVFWCFEIPCKDIRYRVAHACGSRCTRGCKHWAPLWFTENIRLLMWILSIPISIIDLNVHRWSTTKLMQVNSHESRLVASDGLTKCIQAMASLNIYKNSANKFGRKIWLFK